MKKITKTFFALFFITALIISQTGCTSEEPVSKTSYYFDTICTIDIYSMDEDEASDIIQEAFSRCSDYEKILSKTVENSDIWNINHSGGKPVTVADDTVEVLKKGIYYSDISDGAFDISIGRLTELWDFHSENPEVPEKKDIEDAVKHTDYRKIDIEGNVVTISDPEMRIDLGGVAKGYICDRICEHLKSQGVESGVVNLGGNIAVIGEKNGKDPFKVGIERPFSDKTESVGYVEASDKTFVTSGIYERCFEKNGKMYHHILDRKTGYPAKSDVELVTIIADEGMSADCDAISTTCLVLGVEKGMEFINGIDGIEAVFIDKNDKITCTEGADFEKE